MVSAAVLERTAWWRAAGLIALLVLVLRPAAPLLLQSGSAPGTALSVDRAFSRAIWNSALVALATAATSFAAGLPLGVMVALYNFPARRPLLALVALPLLLPSFLSAIGWSSLSARLGSAAWDMAAGLGGCALVFALAMIPLVLFTAHAATLALTSSQVDAARLSGGEIILIRLACRHAAVPALLAAVLVGRREHLRTLTIGMSLAFFSLPPALGALGIVQLAAAAPPWADPLLRSRFTVSAALALRFLPVATLLALRAWGSTSPSWAFAAGIHGVSLGTYAWKVVIPSIRPTLAFAALVVALLATADITTVLLLSPPGEASMPQSIFTVMANAPEALVARLCLLYLTAASIVLATLSFLAGGDRA